MSGKTEGHRVEYARFHTIPRSMNGEYYQDEKNEGTESSSELERLRCPRLDTNREPADKQVDVLPLNSRVRVIGNKRTSPSLVGKVGLVVKTACLGGWHKLKMDSGKSVKVQRNGLDVLEWGNGEKPEDMSDSDDFIEERRRCLDMEKCEREAAAMLPLARSTRTRKRGFESYYSCRSVRQESEGSRSPGGTDFSKLEVPTLRRFLRTFHKPFPPNASRGLMTSLACDHFITQDVDEVQVAIDMCRKRRRL
ncbi:hypothetical protein BSKO_09001 [Bryopsis sp. KO-2023]|nr:hypothetical protein BSKO_09001 [Bryopsis sp. KO-2023]